MADDIVFILPFVFFQKFFGTTESHLVQVFVHFFCCHPDALISDGECFLFNIQSYFNIQVTQLALCFSE